MDNVPIVLAQYRLGKTLGIGAFGKVKLPHHATTGFKVAVKILNKGKIKHLEMAEKVRRETSILQICTHPHIFRLYEVIDTPSDMRVIMDYFSDGELFDYIVSRGRLPPDEARHFFHQIVSGIEHCRYRIVHSNLEPENLLLDADNTIKMADFGWSHDGDFLRTSCDFPNYAAPEVISGNLYAGPEVDVWSCGVILYALLCGTLPFDDESIPNLFKKIKSGMYSLPSHLSQSARELILRTLVVAIKRITIADVRQHPLYQHKLPAYLSLPPAMIETQERYIDAEIVDKVCRLPIRGVTPALVTDAVENADKQPPDLNKLDLQAASELACDFASLTVHPYLLSAVMLSHYQQSGSEAHSLDEHDPLSVTDASAASNDICDEVLESERTTLSSATRQHAVETLPQDQDLFSFLVAVPAQSTPEESAVCIPAVGSCAQPAGAAADRAVEKGAGFPSIAPQCGLRIETDHTGDEAPCCCPRSPAQLEQCSETGGGPVKSPVKRRKQTSSLSPVRRSTKPSASGSEDVASPPQCSPAHQLVAPSSPQESSTLPALSVSPTTNEEPASQVSQPPAVPIGALPVHVEDVTTPTEAIDLATNPLQQPQLCFSGAVEGAGQGTALDAHTGPVGGKFVVSANQPAVVEPPRAPERTAHAAARVQKPHPLLSAEYKSDRHRKIMQMTDEIVTIRRRTGAQPGGRGSVKFDVSEGAFLVVPVPDSVIMNGYGQQCVRTKAKREAVVCYFATQLHEEFCTEVGKAPLSVREQAGEVLVTCVWCEATCAGSVTSTHGACEEAVDHTQKQNQNKGLLDRANVLGNDLTECTPELQDQAMRAPVAATMTSFLLELSDTSVINEEAVRDHYRTAHPEQVKDLTSCSRKARCGSIYVDADFSAAYDQLLFLVRGMLRVNLRYRGALPHTMRIRMKLCILICGPCGATCPAYSVEHFEMCLVWLDEHMRKCPLSKKVGLGSALEDMLYADRTNTDAATFSAMVAGGRGYNTEQGTSIHNRGVIQRSEQGHCKFRCGDCLFNKGQVVLIDLPMQQDESVLCSFNWAHVTEHRQFHHRFLPQESLFERMWCTQQALAAFCEGKCLENELVIDGCTGKLRMECMSCNSNRKFGRRLQDKTGFITISEEPATATGRSRFCEMNARRHIQQHLSEQATGTAFVWASAKAKEGSVTASTSATTEMMSHVLRKRARIEVEPEKPEPHAQPQQPRKKAAFALDRNEVHIVEGLATKFTTFADWELTPPDFPSHTNRSSTLSTSSDMQQVVKGLIKGLRPAIKDSKAAYQAVAKHMGAQQDQRRHTWYKEDLPDLPHDIVNAREELKGKVTGISNIATAAKPSAWTAPSIAKVKAILWSLLDMSVAAAALDSTAATAIAKAYLFEGIGTGDAQGDPVVIGEPGPAAAGDDAAALAAPAPGEELGSQGDDADAHADGDVDSDGSWLAELLAVRGNMAEDDIILCVEKVVRVGGVQSQESMAYMDLDEFTRDILRDEMGIEDPGVQDQLLNLHIELRTAAGYDDSQED